MKRLPQNSLTYEERSALVEANLNVAFYWANRLRWSRLPIEDLECAALEGLAKAATLFQPSYGYKFSTYSQHWVRTYVFRFIQVQQKHGFRCLGSARPRKVGPGRANSKGREPPMPHEVAEARTERPSARLEQAEIWTRLMKLLHPRLRDVAEMLYRKNMTLEETGQILGITRERVRQLELQLIDKLRVFARNMLADATGCEVPIARKQIAN